jgi:hypothetical protein
VLALCRALAANKPETSRISESKVVEPPSDSREADNLLVVSEKRLEAASGLEPENRGFADLRLSHLATPPLRVHYRGESELEQGEATTDSRATGAGRIDRIAM